MITFVRLPVAALRTLVVDDLETASAVAGGPRVTPGCGWSGFGFVPVGEQWDGVDGLKTVYERAV
ncbi:hypothetical protein [Couchioplanes caeruleus]|uniref:Uncharacterized protein n=1 Tax=Couchioplanes caeruleus subsp. caeruleus TaxID=56427 RepID=A0A1K0GSR5_9ACTN|nr:hypothetical protein [Couchioplanes caeruleus]OJF15486.1 hypothetical protein BG844_04440 [Couchioplanes caeruleus subsp. caeruleus]